MTELYNKTSEKEKRQRLRNNMPPAEKIIWAKLRNRQIEECKFRRQYSVGAFVIDFYAPELKLAIEIDGPSHFQAGAPEYDRDRQLFLESKGIQFLRFTNHQIYQDLDSAIESISETIQILRPHPSPLLGKEREPERPHPNPLLFKEREPEERPPPFRRGDRGGSPYDHDRRNAAGINNLPWRPRWTSTN
jgi:very-short-patch-repair endonuclease